MLVVTVYAHAMFGPVANLNSEHNAFWQHLGWNAACSGPSADRSAGSARLLSSYQIEHCMQKIWGEVEPPSHSTRWMLIDLNCDT